MDWLYEQSCETARDVVVREFGLWQEGFQRQRFEAKRRLNLDRRVIEANGERFGIVILGRRPDHDWLAEILVDPRYQGRGRQDLAECRSFSIRNMNGSSPQLLTLELHVSAETRLSNRNALVSCPLLELL